MRSRKNPWLVRRGLVGVIGVLSALALPAQNSTLLRQPFLNPPADAKPMVRWWWFGPAVTQPEISRELAEMKADGIGGAELAFVYPEALDDPARNLNNLPFLSSEMLQAVTFAQAEGRRLGLRIDLTLCSGWPYGGPAITLEQAATRLKTVEVLIPANTSTIPPPRLQPGDQFLSAAIVPGEPRQWHAADAKPLPGSHPPDSIPPAPEARTALLFYLSHTRQQVKRAAVGAEGYVLDPFSRAAVATHLRAVGEPLLQAFGSTPPYAIFSDSLEAYGADWTPDLPAQFLRRRGYDLLPRLPELVAGGTPAADTLRHDYGQTLTELVDENYLTQINEWAHAHNTRFRSQTYGEPAVDFSSQHLVTLAEGEGPQWRQFSTLRWATSANHVFGNAITSGETYTWLHSPVFRATPLDMKLEADIDFLSGENQLIFHGWPYSPPAPGTVPAGTQPVLAAGDPGWSLYAAAALNDHNPWHPVMPAVTAYLTRVSWLLRQGQPANQVAILLPTDDAWASFTPGHVSVTAAMTKLIPPDLIEAILSAGYNFDFIDAKALETVGPGTHQAIVIPPTTRIPTATLGKLAAFQTAGGKVFYMDHLPTLDAHGGPLPEPKMSPGTLVPDASHLGEALQAQLSPDLRTLDSQARDSRLNPNSQRTTQDSKLNQNRNAQLKTSLNSELDSSLQPASSLPKTLGYIRRRLPDADIYFLANTGNKPLTLQLTVSSRFTSGVVLDPETGAVAGSVASASLPLSLAPYESRIFLFSASAPPAKAPATEPYPIADLSRDWTVTFPTLNKTVSEPNRTDWTADPATLHFSGEAVYTRDFTLPQLPATPVAFELEGGQPEPDPATPTPAVSETGPNGLPNPLVTRTGPGIHAYFEPPLHEAALVLVNGQPAGALWHPPYRLDITKLLKPGRNHLEIHVFNTALNAWSALPPRDYGPLKAKYGDRFQMQDLDRVRPIPSGLLGPIHLVGVPTP